MPRQSVPPSADPLSTENPDGVGSNLPPDLAASRYRLAAWGAAANVASRGAGMLLMVMTVHWASPYLGAERFGLWATFASLAAMLSFLDLGVGNALINRVAAASAEGSQESLRRVVTAGVGWLLLIGFVSAIALTTASVFIPWSELFKLSRAQIGLEARHAGQVFSICFGLNVVSSGLLKILIGQQRAYEAHLISAFGTVAACAVVWSATKIDASVPVLLASGFGTQSLVGCSALAILRMRNLISGHMLQAMTDERQTLLKTGGLFLLLQIGTMVGWGSDSFMLASIGGATSVAAFAVAQRLFMLATQPFAVINGALWPAYADAYVRHDYPFIKKTLQRSFAISLGGGSFLIILLLLLSSWLLPVWTSGSITVTNSLLVLVASWAAIEVMGNAFSVYLNGTNIVRAQVVVVICFCACAIPAKFFATMLLGAQGLVAATISCYLLVAVTLYATVYREQVLAPLGRSVP